MNTRDKLIHLGKVNKVHGIKGQFKLILFNTDDSCLKKGVSVWLKPLSSESSLVKSGEEKKVSSIQFGNHTIISFEGVQDRTQAEKILPFDILIEQTELPTLQEGEFYLKDLIGLKVLNSTTKKELGFVKGFYENGAQVVLQIKGELSVDLPFVDHFFPEVSVEKGFLTIVPPEEF